MFRMHHPQIARLITNELPTPVRAFQETRTQVNAALSHVRSTDEPFHMAVAIIFAHLANTTLQEED